MDDAGEMIDGSPVGVSEELLQGAGVANVALDDLNVARDVRQDLRGNSLQYQASNRSLSRRPAQSRDVNQTLGQGPQQAVPEPTRSSCNQSHISCHNLRV